MAAPPDAFLVTHELASGVLLPAFVTLLDDPHDASTSAQALSTKPALDLRFT
jgi:hypothetical protein